VIVISLKVKVKFLA